ncbi:MAG TPA: hypothetical protein VF619_04385 [Allosphingosinicella sp.]
MRSLNGRYKGGRNAGHETVRNAPCTAFMIDTSSPSETIWALRTSPADKWPGMAVPV